MDCKSWRCLPHFTLFGWLLTLGSPTPLILQEDLITIIRICKDLRVPLAFGKIEGLFTTLPFLGIMLDRVVMKTRLPHYKLERMCNMVSTWLKKKKATKKILSLVGLLQHETKVVQHGRPFLSWMYATAAKVKQVDYYICLNRDFHFDLHWWNAFLVSWNALSLLRNILVGSQFHIHTDASRSWGCGAVFLDQWFQLPWEES